MDTLIGRQNDGPTIISSTPDPKKNRIVLEISSLEDKFLYRIAELYGSDAVAVRIVGNVETAPADSRGDDRSPFLGGASLVFCTSGFAWQYGSVEMMLTAGHCYDAGSRDVRTPASPMGFVTPQTRENWADGGGTVPFRGASSYRGDLALVEITGGRGSTDRIFIGDVNSATTAFVVAKSPSSPSYGDRYCTGGRSSGERCSWDVEWQAAGNYFYTGTEETARRVWLGRKYGRCIIGGDSGGPVYTVNAGGQVLAKGVISGVSGYGGSDNTTAFPEAECVNVFTDIYDAFVSLPGDLN